MIHIRIGSSVDIQEKDECQSSVPSKISRSQLSDTQPKMTGPPPHLIKKIKNCTRKIEKISPKIHENMNVSISPVNNKKTKQQKNKKKSQYTSSIFKKLFDII